MREIKFRYTCKRDNGHVFSQIFTLEEIEAGDAKKWIDINHIGLFHLKKDQYTGRKDSKGQEIYEGDIVRQYQHGIEDNNLYLRTGAVEYREDRFWCLGHKVHFFLSGAFRDIPKSTYEIIGNIYQNPELIKEAS